MKLKAKNDEMEKKKKGQAFRGDIVVIWLIIFHYHHYQGYVDHLSGRRNKFIGLRGHIILYYICTQKGLNIISW